MVRDPGGGSGLGLNAKFAEGSKGERVYAEVAEGAEVAEKRGKEGSRLQLSLKKSFLFSRMSLMIAGWQMMFFW